MDACQRKLALGQGFYNTGQYRQVTYLHITNAHVYDCMLFFALLVRVLQCGRLNVMSTRLGGFFPHVEITTCTVIRFVSITAKFDVCTVVAHSSVPRAFFSFIKCPI